MLYFKNCNSYDDAKKLFYALTKKYHPDLNPGIDDTIIKEVINQWGAFGKNPNSFNKDFKEKYKGEKEQFKAEDYTNVINELLKIEGITIEIIGSFIWISGTKKEEIEKREMIKNIDGGEMLKKALWHRKKSMWYFSPKGYRRFAKGSFSMDEIRGKYGSKAYNSKGSTKISA